MDFSRIKKIVKQNGDKVIVVENDEPEFVMMSFAEYEKLTARRPEPVATTGRDEFAPIRGAGFEETEFIRPAVASSRQSFVRPEDVRLEDLPL